MRWLGIQYTDRQYTVFCISFYLLDFICPSPRLEQRFFIGDKTWVWHLRYEKIHSIKCFIHIVTEERNFWLLNFCDIWFLQRKFFSFLTLKIKKSSSPIFIIRRVNHIRLLQQVQKHGRFEALYKETYMISPRPIGECPSRCLDEIHLPKLTITGQTTQVGSILKICFRNKVPKW